MSIARHHSEWLSLVEVSGPFLSMPVLMRAFPQGLVAHDSDRFRTLKLAFEEWQANDEAGHRTNPAIHLQWVKFVLTQILDLPADQILEHQAIPQSLMVTPPGEHAETIRPNLVLNDPAKGKARLLVHIYPSGQDLEKPVAGTSWKASPGTRMMELLHATGVRLGLVTNGERWMLVDAPKDGTTGFASWYATIWTEEPITFRAFVSLLSAGRFFAVAESDTLEALLAESASNQQEVTEQLGYQVRRAVEVLVQAVDRVDQDREGQLLQGVGEKVLYEAALTFMMRLVFLFCAEERRLFPIDNPLYARHYAASTLRDQLRKTADDHGEEILERRHDAWSRLLSTYRLIYGGCEHPELRLPAYSGHLLDPDRFPFLEGRKYGTTWRNCEAEPLPINNRTVLHLLESLQLLEMKVPGSNERQARRLSFRALDIEQIGHVYEGLLDHTAKRAMEPMLGLVGGRDREPETSLSKLEELLESGEDRLVEYLKEETGRSAAALKKALAQELDLQDASRLRAVCGNDEKLFKRAERFAGLIRQDTYDYPVVIRQGSAFVTAGTDRRSSGTHYTPRSLTEPIVRYTLEPLVYIGPAEGKPEKQWKLRSAKELLDLKICDMACGSGAFLVQACRYLSERLVEAWEEAEKAHPGVPGITPEGEASKGTAGESLIPKDSDEQVAYAKRMVAQRCLYGVDINPLAAEMAKLSLWLLTIAKDKPFTFLDHAIRSGDSLLGINDLRQLKTFSLAGEGQFKYLFTDPLERVITAAMALRLRIESMTSNTVEDVEEQSRLLIQYEQHVSYLKSAADFLIAAEMKEGNAKERFEHRDNAAIQVGHYVESGNLDEFRKAAAKELGRSVFHWPLEFPEIMARGKGFSAFIGNPPFIGGMRIEPILGSAYRQYLVNHLAGGRTGTRGAADLSSYFLLRASLMVSPEGFFTLITSGTVPQGDARIAVVEALIRQGFTIHRAESAQPWPGTAATQVCIFWFARPDFRSKPILDGVPVNTIPSTLVADLHLGEAHALKANSDLAFEGAKTAGIGFLLTREEASVLLAKNPSYSKVVRRYMSGEDANTHPAHDPSRWVINFRDMPLSRSTADETECAEDFPDCLSVVEERVKPERLALAGRTAQERNIRERWWQFYLWRPALATAIADLKRVIVSSRVTAHHNFCFAPTDIVFSDRLVVIAKDDYATFAIISSTVHGDWAHRPGATTQGTTLNYFPTWSFGTFPFPDTMDGLGTVGMSYDEYRKGVLVNRQEGLTKTYNRFHNADEPAKDIQKLRDLHVEMDKAVAAAYGWDDLKLGHDFHQTKQGLHFTISESARREVLARLLKLNHERYAEEVAQGLHDKGKSRGAAKTRRRSKPAESTSEGTLFGGDS